MSAESGYIPGQPWDGDIPLARYLPRLEEGVMTKWINAHSGDQGMLIDPFGTSPSLALEVARNGRQILVAANNPIAKFLIEAAASAPASADLQAALSELAAARRGQERLEPHIISLYTTECDHCNQQVTAEAFLWRKDEQAPYARIYACPHCDNSGEFPATQTDQNEAAKFTASGLHRSRALERIAPIGSPHRKHAEDALDVYPPRAMYALSILVNKLDGLALDAKQRKLLEALLLTTMDRSNAMWSHPRGRTRPKQLSIPTQFREHNIWYSLERSVSQWESDASEIRVSSWPQIPEGEAGICLYEGRVRDLSRELKSLDIAAVVTALPRPNQAFWTLSALWSGWLWGHEALGAFESVLGRRRYDWAWHTGALHSALHRLKEGLGKTIPVFSLVTESEARFEAAALIAGNYAELHLDQLDLRPQAGQSQFTWRMSKTKEKTSKTGDATAVIQKAAGEVLEEIGQPTEFSRMQAAALLQLQQKGWLASIGKTAGEAYSEFNTLMELSLSMGNRFKRFGGGEDLEGGLWWLQEQQGSSDPLADRVEVAVVQHLIKNAETSFESIDEEMCRQFPGLLTPPRDLIVKLVSSYGRDSEALWSLNPSDSPEARRVDLDEIKQHIATLGNRLGYEVVENAAIRWTSAEKHTLYCFHVQASALFKEILDHQHRSENAFIVLPGGRAELVLFKLKQDPRMQEIIQAGWKFIKFRGLRRLADNPTVQRDSIEELFALDPLAEDDPQIPLL